MMALRGWCTSPPPRRIRPSRVDRSNWKAECAETCLLRLERGKGCEALPIATLFHCRASMSLYVPLGSSPEIGRSRPCQIGGSADAEEAWSLYHGSAYLL